MTRSLANDPGGQPGYALLDRQSLAPRRLARGTTLHLPTVIGLWGAFPGRVLYDVAVTELQWLYGPTSDKKKKAILVLAPRAGWQLCRMCQYGAEPHAQKPQEWRAALGISPRTEKTVVAARVERSLLPSELALVRATRLPPSRLGDLYDAIAIGWGDFVHPRPWKVPP